MRALVGSGRPAMGVRGFRCVWRVWDGYCGFDMYGGHEDVWARIGMGMKGFK